MSVWRCDGAPHPVRATIGQSPGETRELCQTPNQALRPPPSPLDSGAMPPLYPRTMEDVDDAEEAELRWLEGRAPGGIAPLPSSFTFDPFCLHFSSYLAAMSTGWSDGGLFRTLLPTHESGCKS